MLPKQIMHTFSFNSNTRIIIKLINTNFNYFNNLKCLIEISMIQILAQQQNKINVSFPMLHIRALNQLKMIKDKGNEGELQC